MRFKLYDVEAVFRYGPLGTSDGKLTCIDIKKCYQNLGGSITPDTEIEFSTYFPGKPYAKTALTDNMPSVYLCEGSGSALIYQADGDKDAISVSVYRDTSGHLPAGDHYNLFLQSEINGKRNHTDKIDNRHIPVKDGVIIKLFVNEKEIAENTAIIK